jgi:uncharacterized protein (DUF1810 family)
MKDTFNLRRFTDAQDRVFEHVVQELTEGQKRGHWMWYIFPQIQGLGHSPTAQRFAISSREEAVAYLEHPILGTRLRQCTQLVNSIEGRSIKQIFYHPDHLKFRSSMTLFMASTTDNEIFKEALDKYFVGKPDNLTLDILKTMKKQ